jgi:hypothetical protein
MKWLLLLLLTSCSANWHLQQATKKGARVTQDKWDTVIVTKERQLFDTLILKEIDSVVVRKDNIQVSLIRKFDTIRLKAICLPDTIRVTKWVKTTIKPNERPVRTWVFISICCFLLAMLFRNRGRKKTIEGI